MRKYPQLLRNKSNQTAREAIHLLKDFGFTKNKLKCTNLRSPTIISKRVDRKLKPKMEFLKEMGLATQETTYIVLHQPCVPDLSLKIYLAPRILHLETLFGSKVDLCKALIRAPQLLMSDFKKEVIPRVEYLKNILEILEDFVLFTQALSVVLSLSFETLENKIKHMASLGLVEEEIIQILKRRPRALDNSTKKIKENIDFLIHTVGLEPKNVIFNLVLIDISVEKRIKPYYEVFQSLRTNPHTKVLPGFVRFFKLSEQEFLKYFVQYSKVQSSDHTI